MDDDDDGYDDDDGTEHPHHPHHHRKATAPGIVHEVLLGGRVGRPPPVNFQHRPV